jgi:hypothetical protein
MKLKFLLLTCIMTLNGCSLFTPRQSNEMEMMSEDVLKAQRGIEIQIFPLPKADK